MASSDVVYEPRGVENLLSVDSSKAEGEKILYKSGLGDEGT